MAPALQRRLAALLLTLVCLAASPAWSQPNKPSPERIARFKAALADIVLDPAHKDDRFVLVCLEEALAAMQEGSGGVGACLVREATGEIVERGRNRQYAPYFRSDMHAEMDLLTRYEDRIRPGFGPGRPRPREMEGLVLYSSMEPCPMCLIRIINAGVPKVCYAAADAHGGMVGRIPDLPPFWRERAETHDFRPADCSAPLKDLALAMFGHSNRQRVK